MTTTLKKCPRCASSVPAEAFVCAHCRATLPRVAAGWWEASDGVWYPPHQHPDYPNNLPAPVPRAPWTARRKVLVGAAVAVAAGIMVVGAANGDEASDDVLGREACEEFADLRDIDLYTMEELRVQVQQIYRDGQYAETPAIAAASRDLLRAVTVGDGDALVAAAGDMAAACDTL